jgi:hypothetical protein
MASHFCCNVANHNHLTQPEKVLYRRVAAQDKQPGLLCLLLAAKNEQKGMCNAGIWQGHMQQHLQCCAAASNNQEWGWSVRAVTKTVTHPQRAILGNAAASG